MEQPEKVPFEDLNSCASRMKVPGGWMYRLWVEERVTFGVLGNTYKQCKSQVYTYQFVPGD